MSSEWFVWDPSTEREARKTLLISLPGTLVSATPAENNT